MTENLTLADGTFDDGWFVFVKSDCPTCEMVAPLLPLLAEPGVVTVCQDTGLLSQETQLPQGTQPPRVIVDHELELSFRHGIETVPTLIQWVAGAEQQRIEGWQRQPWRDALGLEDLGDDLPPARPGCGSASVLPGIAERLAAKFGDRPLLARRIEVAELEDSIEACYERGWSDGLPVVPPTEARVMRMLAATRRAPSDIVAVVPPDGIACSVEKVAINAVLAGCRPEYLPVVLAAVEAACRDEFCMHGLLATTWFSGPVVVVGGPLSRALGMNSGINALGPGNRANATIGRALQLVIRNVGGGRPGGIDRSTLGQPGKYTFCFAEDEAGSPWPSLAESRGFAPGSSTVTLFAGDGVQGVFDQQSRNPQSLCASFASALLAVCHPKLAFAADAMLVVSPEHARIFRQDAWSRDDLIDEIMRRTSRPGSALVRGADGCAEGLPAQFAEATLPKFRPGGLLVTHAGGDAGLFSAIIGGWPASGDMGSTPVTALIEH